MSEEKTKYKVTNRPEYNQTLIKRGHVTLWLNESERKQGSFRKSLNHGFTLFRGPFPHGLEPSDVDRHRLRHAHM